MVSKATKVSLSLTAAIAAVFASIGWAETITIQNDSFEVPILANGAWQYGVPSWTLAGGTEGGVWNPALEADVPSNVGVNQDFLDGVVGANVAWSNGANIRQDLAVEVGSGYLYTLKAKVGGRIGYSNEPFGVLLRSDPDGPGGATTLTLNGVFGRNVGGTWSEETATFESDITTDPAVYTQKLVVVLANSGTRDTDPGTDGVQINFDNVSLMRQRLVSCEGFFAPFDKVLALKRKENRAIPIKMRLYDYLANELTDADFAVPPVVNVMMLPAGGTAEDAVPSGDLVSAGLAEDGNSFRYDPIARQWIINLAAKIYKTPGTYLVNVEMGDAEFAVHSTATCSGSFVRE